MKLSLGKMMPAALFHKATGGGGKTRQAPAPGSARDAKTKKRGVFSKLRDMYSSRKTADATPAPQPTQATATALPGQSEPLQAAVAPIYQQLQQAPATLEPASTAQSEAQLTQQAAQAVAAKAAQMLTSRAEGQRQAAQSMTAPATSSPAAQPAEELGRVNRMVPAERIAQMVRAQQTQAYSSDDDDSADDRQFATPPSQPQQHTSSRRTSSTSSDQSLELQQPVQRPLQLMLQEDYNSFSPVVMPGDSAHIQLIHMSRALMTRSNFEHDPKMLAWEIAAVKAGSFRRAPPLPNK